MSGEISRAISSCGTEERDAASRLLRAGPLSAELENGNLRSVRFADIEVLRGIAFLVRDENWGTFTPEISDLAVNEESDRFSVSYRASCRDAQRRLSYEARIEARGTGSLSFEVTALAETELLTNRTGFVVLHPLAGVAGRVARVVHSDGSETVERFPELISPSQPIFDIHSLSHQIAPGVWAICTMEGDAFEMEDQRNWSDASYKTYIRPLAKPWPYALAQGSRHTQSVRLRIDGTVRAARPTDSEAVEVAIGGPAGTLLPEIGIGVPAEEAAHALAARDLVRRLGPRRLVCQIDARQPLVGAVLAAYRDLALATRAAATLEIVIPGGADPRNELTPVAAAVARAGLKADALTVFPASDLMSHQPGHEDPTVPPAAAICAAARAVFPGLRLGVGMASYFTELNRKRPPVGLGDFVTHTTCPIVHAADDRSVMETLEALPAIIGSTIAFSGGRPRRVGPSAIGCRQNPYGSAPFANSGGGRVCLAQVDPRQRGLFGAAWTLGYIAAFARGGVQAIALGAPTGPFGCIYRRTEYPQPYFDALGVPAVYPAFHVIAGLARDGGQPLLDAVSAWPQIVDAIAYRSGGRTLIWLCNLTARPVVASLRGLAGGTTKAAVADAASFARLTADPDALAMPALPIADRTIELDAYAVAHLVNE